MYSNKKRLPIIGDNNIKYYNIYNVFTIYISLISNFFYYPLIPYGAMKYIIIYINVLLY